MRHPTKYFIWNKLSDFVRGSHYNMDASSSGIQLADIQQEEGYYYSRLLDSKEKQMQWHRLLVEGDTISESSVRFWIYTSEYATIFYGDKEWELNTLLADETISEKEKQTILQVQLQTLTALLNFLLVLAQLLIQQLLQSAAQL